MKYLLYNNFMKNKMYKIIQIVLLCLLAISSGLLIYSLILFTGIKKLYIIFLIVIVSYISLFIGYLINKNYRLNRPKRFLSVSIISVIIFGVYLAGFYFLTSVHSKLDFFSKDEIKYETVLLTFNEKYKTISDVKDSKIGIVNDAEDPELYVLPNKVIEKNSLKENNELVKYDSTIDLMGALYKKEIDLIFINGNYKDLFINIDEFSDLPEKAIEITKYSEVAEVKKEVTESGESKENTLNKPFTVLILGVDSTNNVNAAFNGDTIMIVTFNPKTLNATMFSIPRDTYAKIACGNRQFQKINTSAYGGANCVIKTVQNITGINIDYYVKINFKGVVDLVDALGGVEVDVPYSFCEQNSNRYWDDFTVFVEKGYHVINGEQALALSRNRHSAKNSEFMKKYCPDLTDGVRNDFVRGQNQQKVIEGILKKVKEIRNANKLLEILDVISKNIDTNLSTDEMFSFYEVLESLIGAKDLDLVNIQKTFLRGYDMMIYEPNVSGYRYAFFNYKGSMNDIVKLMKQNLELESPNIVKAFSFSVNKPYEQVLVGDNKYSESKLPTVPNFSRYTKSQVESWGSKNGIKVHFINYNTNEEITDISGMNFVGQSIHEDTLVVKAGDTLNMYYASKKTEEKPVEQPTSE